MRKKIKKVIFSILEMFYIYIYIFNLKKKRIQGREREKKRKGKKELIIRCSWSENEFISIIEKKLDKKFPLWQ